MDTTTFRLALVGGLALAALAGCGGDKRTSNYIVAWGMPFTSLTIGQSAKLDVVLSQPAPGPDKLYVDAENRTADTAKVDPPTLAYKPGDTKQTVTITALKAGKVTITFTVRGTSETRDFQFDVVAEKYPEAGPPTPDKGTAPTPDKGTAPTPDKGAPAPDKGATADK